MDSVTQIVLGASVGEAVLGKKAGNKAMLYGAVAGTIPDLDTFAGYFVDTVTAIEVHRGFSHSIFFSVASAPVFGWLISKIERRSRANWKDWSWLMFFGLLTHPLLDCFTTWGTQLFWPLGLRVSFRSIFVIDPLYTLPFIVFLVLAMFSERGSKKRRNYNMLGIFISSGYLLLSLGLKGLAYMEFKSALAEQGIEYLQLETKPSPFNTILWTANAEVDDAYLIGDYSFFDSKPIKFKQYSKNHQLLGELRSAEQIERLIDISQGWFIITEQESELFFNDLRFGVLDADAERPTFVFSYNIVKEGEGIKIEEVERKPAQAKRLMIDLGNRILGN